MANHVKVAMVNAIKTLKKLGWPKRRIARELGIDRETVTRYFELEQLNLKPATNAPIGSDAISKPASNAPIGSKTETDPPPSRPPGTTSRCEPYRSIIEDKIGLGLKNTELAHAQCDTIRLKLLKVGAQIRVTVRKVWVSLSQSWPYREIFAIACV